MPRVRLEAEIIRDQILAVAGTSIARSAGRTSSPTSIRISSSRAPARNWPGKPDDDPSTWRRSLYVFSKRSIRYPLFETFDQPNLVNSCDRRNRSTIAPQALLLMNNKLVLTQAEEVRRTPAARGGRRPAGAGRARVVRWARPPAFERTKAREFVRPKRPTG